MEMVISIISESDFLGRREEMRFKQMLVTADTASNLEANWNMGGCDQVVPDSPCSAPPGRLGSVLSRWCCLSGWNRGPSDLALFSLNASGKIHLFHWSWAGSWKLLLLIVLRWKLYSHESLQNIWSSKKNKVLFLHIQEQLCQAMWIVCVAKMFHEHFDFVTTKGHLPTHKCTFHTNHYQHYTG